MATRKDRTEYTEEVKEIAVEAYHVTGSPTQVSGSMNIPPSTVATWAKKDKEEGINSPSGVDNSLPNKDIGPSDIDSVHTGETSSIAIQLRELRFEKKKAFIEAGATLAMEILTEMRTKVKAASFKDLAVGLGIIQDKVALAAGEATARSESIHSVDREELLKAAQEVGDKVKTLPKTHKKAV